MKLFTGMVLIAVAVGSSACAVGNGSDADEGVGEAVQADIKIPPPVNAGTPGYGWSDSWDYGSLPDDSSLSIEVDSIQSGSYWRYEAGVVFPTMTTTTYNSSNATHCPSSQAYISSELYNGSWGTWVSGQYINATYGYNSFLGEYRCVAAIPYPSSTGWTELSGPTKLSVYVAGYSWDGSNVDPSAYVWQQ